MAKRNYQNAITKTQLPKQTLHKYDMRCVDCADFKKDNN